MKHALQGLRVSKCLGLIGILPLWLAACGSELATVERSASVPPAMIAAEMDKTVDHLDRLEFKLNKNGEKVYDAAKLSVFEEIAAYANESRKIAGTPKALFVISGGWNSCSMGQFFDTGAEFLRAELRRGVKYKFVASCYGKMSDTVYYLTSENARDLIETSPAKIAATAALKGDVTETKHIYVVGHSYGGWLAMNIAWYMPKSAVVKGLVTVDPISKVNCTPSDLLGSYLRSQFSTWPHQGCAEYPTDFTAADLAYVSGRAGFWHNYYQTAATYLHSSPVVGAKNYYVYYDVDSIMEIFDPHRFIDSDERVWKIFSPLISAG